MGQASCLELAEDPLRFQRFWPLRHGRSRQTVPLGQEEGAGHARLVQHSADPRTACELLVGGGSHDLGHVLSDLIDCHFRFYY